MATQRAKMVMAEVRITTSPSAVKKITLTPRPEGFLLSFEGSVTHILKGRIEEWFSAYFKRQPRPIDFPLDMEELSPFSRNVLEAMQKIPFGSVQTYAQLAESASCPKGARAVGNVCRANPFPLIIPCHRVVARHGLGGFAYGLEMKMQLLDFEI